jgi:hypothetical protein
MTTVDDCRVIELPKIVRPQGSITPVEGSIAVPFDIARIYYLYDVPAGAERGGHAHKELEQIIVSAMASFGVVLDDGHRRRTVTLNRPFFGLYVPRLIWRELVNFSAGGVCLVLASRQYEEEDYIRDYDIFTGIKRRANPVS